MAEVSDAPIWETWESLLQKTTALGNEIIKHTLTDPKKRIDRIAVVPRGGLYIVNILARMLALSGDQVLSLGISKYDRHEANKAGLFKIGQLPTHLQVEGHRVLLADEVHDTGETTEKAVNILTELGAEVVLTAAIHYKPEPNETGRIPDFYIEATNGWVHYPWEVIDPQGSVYQNAMKNGSD